MFDTVKIWDMKYPWYQWLQNCPSTGLDSHGTKDSKTGFLTVRRYLGPEIKAFFFFFFLRNFFMAGFFTFRVFVRNLLKGNRRRNIFYSYFVLIPDLGYEAGLYV